MKENSKNINSQIIISAFSSILINGITFLAAPIFSRMLGTDNYGIITIYEAWIKIFSILCGLQTCSAIGTARVHYGNEKFDNFISTILSLSLLASSLFLIIGLLGIEPFSNFVGLNKTCFAFMLTNSIATYIVNFQSMVYIQKKKAFSNAMLSLGLIFSSIVLSIILINSMDRQKYYGRILGLLIPNICICIFVVINTYRKSKMQLNKEFCKYSLVMGIPTIFHSLSTVLLAQTDKIMLQKLISDYSIVGMYGLVVSFSHILSVIYTAINNAWVPYYYDDMAKR